jgi:iron complex transport system ATP-binding protein
MKNFRLNGKIFTKYQALSFSGVKEISGASVSVRNVSWSSPRSKQTILHEMSFNLSSGRVLGIVGPNGSGKSTLLKLLYRYHKPTTGTIEIGGTDIWKIKARMAARKVAAVLQEQPTDFALTVREIVTLGRTPHHVGFGGSNGAQDGHVVDAALNRMDLNGFSNRSLGTLSGGERQRVMVARALAQEPCVLVLDEPTNHLDIRHQLEILELIKDLPVTIVTSLHDLNMAADICDEVLILKDGHLKGSGVPEAVFSAEAISGTFQVAASYERLAPSGKNLITFNLKA